MCGLFNIPSSSCHFGEFTESWLRVHISNKDTVTAYLPELLYIVSDDTGDFVQQLCEGVIKVSRVQYFRAFQTNIDMSLQPLVDTALCGFTVSTFDHFSLRAHLLLV